MGKDTKALVKSRLMEIIHDAKGDAFDVSDQWSDEDIREIEDDLAQLGVFSRSRKGHADVVKFSLELEAEASDYASALFVLVKGLLDKGYI